MGTTENNILIAEFMGYINNGCSEDGFLICPQTNYDIEIDSLKYHNDWNELMEVVDKILSLHGGIYNVFITKNQCTITADNESYKYTRSENETIEAVYFACINFIKWYNLL